MSRLPEFRNHIFRNTNSFTRMAEILDLKPYLSHRDWCILLGECWTVCDTIRQSRFKLRKALGTVGPVRELMTTEENAQYNNLPEVVTCYRGSDRSVLVGASWTLDQNVAKRFPITNRYKVPSPVVVTATVRKDNILAVKLDRGETEIITFSARRQSTDVVDGSSTDPHTVQTTSTQHQPKGIAA